MSVYRTVAVFDVIAVITGKYNMRGNDVLQSAIRYTVSYR
jgi:hypothetical protein